MQFCSQCGQGNAEDAGFCVQCGATLKQGSEQQGAPTAPTAPVAPPVAPPMRTQTPPPPMTPPVQPGGQAPPPPTPPALAPGAQEEGPGMPPPGYPPVRTQLPTEPMAVASFVAALVAWFFCPVIAAVLAIIFGFIARSNIRQSNGTLGGDGFAMAGLIIGFVNLGVILLAVLVIIIVAVAVGTHGSSSLITPALHGLLALL
jgi:hypothetical protein